MKDSLPDRDYDEPDDLFAKARTSDPSTSHEAAATLDADKLNRIQNAIIDKMRQSGANGLIADDLCRLTGIEWKTLTPRLAPLRVAGWITPWFDASGKEIKRTGASGRGQIVWYLTDKGKGKK